MLDRCSFKFSVPKCISENSKAVTATVFVGAAAFTLISIVGAHVSMHVYVGSTDVSLFFLQHMWRQLVAVGAIAFIMGIVLGSLSMSKHLTVSDFDRESFSSSRTSSISSCSSEESDNVNQKRDMSSLPIANFLEEIGENKPVQVQAYVEDLNKTFFLGRSLLHRAVSKDKVSIMEHLLKRGADVNAIDCLGNTPLHYAHSTEAVRLLRSHPDINPSITNKMGEDYLASIERYNPDLAREIREEVLEQ